jgi:hypothetical protein
MTAGQLPVKVGQHIPGFAGAWSRPTGVDKPGITGQLSPIRTSLERDANLSRLSVQGPDLGDRGSGKREAGAGSSRRASKP